MLRILFKISFNVHTFRLFINFLLFRFLLDNSSRENFYCFLFILQKWRFIQFRTKWQLNWIGNWPLLGKLLYQILGQWLIEKKDINSLCNQLLLLMAINPNTGCGNWKLRKVQHHLTKSQHLIHSAMNLFFEYKIINDQYQQF